MTSFVISTDFTHDYTSCFRMTFSQTWLGKFSKAIDGNKVGMHLFPTTGHGSRPFANIEMKKHFGPLCDSPSPKEYIDPKSDKEEIDALLSAFNNGSEYTGRVYCRNVSNKKPYSMLCVKPLKNKQGEILYRYLIFFLFNV